MGGGGGLYGGGGDKSSLGREARGTVGGAVPDVTASGRDLDGSGGPLVDTPALPGGAGGTRFQLGSQVVLEDGTLENRSRVFVTLVTLTSLAFSALAFNSATGWWT